jgi:hypothetical protein
LWTDTKWTCLETSVSIEPKVREVEPKVRKVEPKVRKVEPKVRKVEPKVRKVEPNVRQQPLKNSKMQSNLQGLVHQTQGKVTLLSKGWNLPKH